MSWAFAFGPEAMDLSASSSIELAAPSRSAWDFAFGSDGRAGDAGGEADSDSESDASLSGPDSLVIEAAPGNDPLHMERARLGSVVAARGRGRPSGQVGMPHWLCRRYNQLDKDSESSIPINVAQARHARAQRKHLHDAFQPLQHIDLNLRSLLGIDWNFLQPAAPLAAQCILALQRADSGGPRTRRHWRKKMQRWMALCGTDHNLNKGYMPIALEHFLVTRKVAGAATSTRNDKIILAGMVWQASLMLWSSFCAWLIRQIDAKELVGHMMTIFIIFDEALIKTGVEEKSSNSNGIAAPTDASNVKVMHTRMWLGFVVQGALTGGAIQIVAGEMVVPLQPMNSSSAECCFEALRRAGAVPIMSLLSSRFTFCVNCCTCDKAASNGRFLRARAALDAGALHLGTFCRIHCLCTTTSRCMKLHTVEADVSGVVRLGLAVRAVGTTKEIRSTLISILMSRHQIKEHEPPLTYDDDRAIFRRRVLQVLLAGPAMSDIRRRHVLDLHVSTITLTETAYHGHVTDKQAFVTAMAEAILPSAIAVLQRGRWMRNVTPWREAALFFWFGGDEALLKWLPAPAATHEDLGGQWDFAWMLLRVLFRIATWTTAQPTKIPRKHGPKITGRIRAGCVHLH